jgi:hypothetical protein
MCYVIKCHDHNPVWAVAPTGQDLVGVENIRLMPTGSSGQCLLQHAPGQPSNVCINASSSQWQPQEGEMDVQTKTWGTAGDAVRSAVVLLL